MGEHHRVVRRHREEQRRPLAFDDVVNDGRRDGPGPEDAGGANREREIHAVSQPVREEQLGHAEAPVALADAEHAARVAVGAHAHVVLQVNAALRATGGAGRIQPECRCVAAGRRGLELRGPGGGERLESDRPLLVNLVAHDDNMAHRLADGDGLAGFARQRAAEDNDPRGRVPDRVLVFSSGPPGVQRYRDRADLDGAEERGNHLRPVQHQQDNAFLGPDAELAPQGRPDPVHLFVKIPIRQPAIAALDRHRVRPALRRHGDRRSRWRR